VTDNRSIFTAKERLL